MRIGLARVFRACDAALEDLRGDVRGLAEPPAPETCSKAAVKPEQVAPFICRWVDVTCDDGAFYHGLLLEKVPGDSVCVQAGMDKTGSVIPTPDRTPLPIADIREIHVLLPEPDWLLTWNKSRTKLRAQRIVDEATHRE